MDRRPSAADLDPAALDLLLAVVRARPATVADLRAIAGHRPDELIGALADAGVIRLDGTGDGDAVTIADLAALVGDAVAIELAGARERLERIEGLVARLPDLLGAEVAGAASGATAGDDRLEVIHGSDRVWEHWSRVANERPPRRPGTSNDDLRVIREQVLTRLDEVRADYEARGYRMRVLTTMTQAAEHPDVVEGLLSIGTEVRVSPAVPGWFYVDDGVVAGIPLEWGAGGPVNGMVVLHTPAAISMLAGYFEDLWGRARPLPLAEHGWESVLELLAQGRTDEQIAADLGLGVRTVRRRIADAMDALGALGRFELGMAWQRELVQAGSTG